MSKLDTLRLPRVPTWLAIVGPALLALLALKLFIDVATQQSFELFDTKVEPQNIPVVVLAAIISLAAAAGWFYLGFLQRRGQPGSANTASGRALTMASVAPLVLAGVGAALLIFAIVLRVTIEINVANSADGGLVSALSGTIKEFGWSLQNGPSLVFAGISLVVLAAVWFAARPKAPAA